VQRLIRANRIEVVIGFGGYASAPAYVAARREKVKLVIHEANALPGIANKIGAKFADVVAAAFPETPLPKAITVGMPLRKEIENVAEVRDVKMARKHFGLDPEAFTLLVTGGSLGAKRINETVEESRDVLSAAGIQILHIVGGKSELEPVKQNGYLRIKYCDRMDLAMAAADFAISRAGATTVAELTAIGIPAVYLPYAVGNGEQSHNLKTVIAAGGGISCADKDFDRQFVLRDLVPLLSSSKKLKAMAQAARNIGVRNGTELLYALVSGVLSK
jgi:UDP-N-acetylglucosamine--N-acetylmuramyl-(pentapeptide) pyrophosphoryl-undecaprenol N-acetylglucosamine transferase